jgi:beta-lactam-binding protein with PASTA domain
MINKVENFIGKNIDDVRMDIRTVVGSTGDPLLTLKEPLMYEFSPAAAGIVIRQKPDPGTDISGPMILEFVVSQGQEDVMITVPQFSGLSIAAALEQIGKTGIVFEFSLREIIDGEKGETIVSQNPPAGGSVSPNTRISLTANTPARLYDDEVFKLFSYNIPPNPYPLPVHLEALLPSGERKIIIAIDFPGGKFTVPYRLPLESILVLSLMNREIYRETVQDYAPPIDGEPISELLSGDTY